MDSNLAQIKVCNLPLCASYRHADTRIHTYIHTQNVVVSLKSQPQDLLRQERLQYFNVRARKELRDDLR